MGLLSLLARRNTRFTNLPSDPRIARAAHHAHRALRASLETRADFGLQTLEDRTLFAGYTIVDLGSVGGPTANAVGVNDAGQVAVTATNSDSVNRAARYSGSTLTDLGSFLGPDSIAYGINGGGHVVGAALDTISGSETGLVGFFWDGSTKTRIGRLNGGSYSVASAVNDGDTVVGFAQNGSGGAEHAVKFKNGTLTDLGTLTSDGADYSHANGINLSGQVVGEASITTGETHAFLMSPTGPMTDIGLLSGGDTASALGVNDAGQVVGRSNTGATETKSTHAFFYDGSMHDLGTLAGDVASTADDINNVGLVVGYSTPDENSSTASKAILYTAADGMQDLNTLIPAGSGWVLEEATSVSDNGYIVGTGLLNGVERAFLLRPQGVGPTDTTPPTATAPVFTAPVEGAATTTVTVTFTDETAVSASTIGVDDLNFSGPVVPTVSSVSITPTADAASIVATYTLTGPGGTWDSSDNGNYTINLLASSVTDSSGNGIAAQATPFTISFGTSTVGPAAVISTPADVTLAGASPTSVTVTYSDADNVSFASIGTDDITISGPDGTVPITGFSANPAGDAGTIAVTYTFVPPGGTWDAGDSGTYAINVVGGAVTDALANGVSSTGSSFDVNIPELLPALDSTFNGGTPVAAGFVAEASVTDLNGKTYVVGHSGSLGDGSSTAILRRYNADGSLDTKFGSGGQAIGGAGSNDAYYNVALDPGGKYVVVSGARGGDLLVARYDVKKGKLDTKYGTKGLKGAFVQPDLGGNEAGYALAVAADGSLFVGGGSVNALFVEKLDKKGKIDDTFGNAGTFVFNTENPSVVSSLILEPSGSLLVAGDDGTGNDGDAANGNGVFVTRLLADGSPDPAFNGGASVSPTALGVRTDLGGPDRTIGLARQSDGKVLVANRTAAGTDFGVVRLDSAGIFDATFGGGDGIATVDLGGNADDADSVQIQGTGQIVLTGTTNVSGTAQTAVAALDTNGIPVTAFGANGVFIVDSGVAGPSGTPTLVGVGSAQPGGKLILVGSDPSAAGSGSAIRRVNIPGSGLLGQAGKINGKTRSLAFTDADGTLITLSTKNATATAYYDGSELDIVLAGTTTKSSLSFKTKGGDGRAHVGNIRSDGGLSSVSGKTVDVSGTFYVNGQLKKLDIGTLNGTLAAAGNLDSLTFRGALAGAKVLAGANLGADGNLGGGDDVYAAGVIGKLSVGDVVTSSVIGAGFDPVDGDFFNGGAVVGGPASIIKSVSVKRSTDAASRFFAGAFGKIKAPEKVTAGTDVRFQIL